VTSPAAQPVRQSSVALARYVVQRRLVGNPLGGGYLSGHVESAGESRSATSLDVMHAGGSAP
jgi:hypothetical protein